jgi:hypothetical protein
MSSEGMNYIKLPARSCGLLGALTICRVFGHTSIDDEWRKEKDDAFSVWWQMVEPEMLDFDWCTTVRRVGSIKGWILVWV